MAIGAALSIGLTQHNNKTISPSDATDDANLRPSTTGRTQPARPK
jgi:hypothetical protein